MKPRLVVCVVVAALATVAGAQGSPGSRGISLTPLARLAFPERGFLVSLPSGVQLQPGDVTVRENGRAVPDPSFVPALSSRQQLGTVLVLDTSDSMHGRPLRAALAAAGDFTSQFQSGERIGLVTFNSRVHMVQPPTAEAGALSRALGRVPATAYGTHIYDALSAALDVIRQAQLSGASIVLLSDGADTGSSTKSTELITRAQRMRVRIFTVGLRSPTFKPGPLTRLARGTGGDFTAATTSQALAPIFAALGHRLASEYFLRYRSYANPGTHVVVSLQIRGLGMSAYEYSSPTISAVPPFQRPLFERFWSSAFSLALISLLASVLAGLAVTALLKRPPSTIRRRIADFATLASTPPQKEEKPLLSARLLGGTERSLARTRRWAQFREELEIANVKISAEQVLGLAVVGALIVGLLLYLIVPAFSIFGLLVPAAVYGYCRRQLRTVRWAFESQLPDNLQVLASALRAGHSFVGALSVVAADASEPSKREFGRVVADEQLGVPLDDSLREVARRMASSDLEQVALVAELQRHSGGNMAEVLDRVVDTVRSRFDLRRMVRTLTAQGRLARWILTFLPVFLAAVISILNPGYIAPLFSNFGGQVVVAISAVMVIVGSLLIKRIVEIRV